MDEVGELQRWLEDVLGTAVDWEVNTQTLLNLKQIRQRNTRREEHAQLILDELERSSSEYEGETGRLERILGRLGVDDKLLAGPSSTYLQVLTESCSLLNEDRTGPGLEAAAARLLVRQARTSPRLAALRTHTERVKADTLKLFSRMERLGEYVVAARKGGEEDVSLTTEIARKLSFLQAKEKQYKASIDKGETLLKRVSGGDSALRHANLEKLEDQLKRLEQSLEEARRQISGYQNLPPSCDLARVEILKAERELDALAEQVQQNIFSIHQ